MAEEKAGQDNAQQQEEQQQDGEQQGQQGHEAGADGGEKKPAERTYSQAELDRILGKVRKNARYLGRKEAEAELRSQGATADQAREAVNREQKAPAKDEAPKREAFENYEEYLEAKARYEGRAAAREERAETEKQAKAKEQREVQEKAARDWHGKIEAAQKKLPDLEEVLEDNEPVLKEIGSSPMRGFITQSDIGPELIYELCKNPDEVKRIKALPAYKQAAEIAKIEEKLLAAAKKPSGEDEEEQSGEEGEEAAAEAEGRDAERNTDGTFKPAKKKAPEPIEPVSGRGANASKSPSDKDDINSWMRKRDAEDARTRRR